jgi:hypothetical protein
MTITIHSDYYVEIQHAGGTTALEYDDAADFAEALRAEPGRADELATMAVEEFADD